MLDVEGPMETPRQGMKVANLAKEEQKVDLVICESDR